MKTEVSTAIEELQRQFPEAAFTIREDGQGGAYVIMDPIAVGSRLTPPSSWMGFQITAQYPYADIYPVFIGANVVRANRTPWGPPITPGQFEGHPALQISRRNGAVQAGTQKATAKVLKILHYLETLP
jgi:hypothetical protein